MTVQARSSGSHDRLTHHLAGVAGQLYLRSEPTTDWLRSSIRQKSSGHRRAGPSGCTTTAHAHATHDLVHEGADRPQPPRCTSRKFPPMASIVRTAAAAEPPPGGTAHRSGPCPRPTTGRSASGRLPSSAELQPPAVTTIPERTRPARPHRLLSQHPPRQQLSMRIADDLVHQGSTRGRASPSGRGRPGRPIGTTARQHRDWINRRKLARRSPASSGGSSRHRAADLRSGRRAARPAPRPGSAGRPAAIGWHRVRPTGVTITGVDQVPQHLNERLLDPTITAASSVTGRACRPEPADLVATGEEERLGGVVTVRPGRRSDGRLPRSPGSGRSRPPADPARSSRSTCRSCAPGSAASTPSSAGEGAVHVAHD